MARANRSVVNSKPNSFNSTWKTDNLSQTSSAANQITLPLSISGSYNFMVYWGDNTSSSISSAFQSDITHSYATAGTYNVTMSGYIKGFGFANGRDRRKIIDISQWGGIKLSSRGSQFYGCDALTLNNISDIPNLYTKNIDFVNSASISAMFRSCSLLTTISRLDQWDTSQVHGLQQTFYQANRFNQNIGSWNTSNARNMANLFSGPSSTFTHSFNNGGSDSIKNWDTSKVTSFSQTFLFNPNFNQPIGSWNVSSASIFNFMFYFAAGFNQPLNTWDTSNATSMISVFFSASTFNQPLNNWNTSKVTDMGSMFRDALIFNQNIGSWDVSNVLSFNAMFFMSFRTGSFNNGGSNLISNWNTSNAVTMSFMFSGQPNFNQEIGKWDVGKVRLFDSLFNNNYTGLSPQRTGIFNNSGSPSIGNWTVTSASTMFGMFSGQKLFNQNIGSWDVSNVTNMGYMFQAPAFNNGGSPTLNNWNVSKVTNMSRMFQASGSQFNQPLNNWNVSNVTDFINFMSDSGFANAYSTENYTNLLIGWASRPVKPNISINFATNTYTLAASASRAILTSAPNNWTIIDGGQV